MRYLLHDVLNDSLKLFPNKIAIKEESGKCTTYRELEENSNQYAHFFEELKNFNLMTQPYLGIISHVDSESICAVFGILKAGGTYVPLDEKSPSNRLNAVINNCHLDTVYAHPSFLVEHESLLVNPKIKHIITDFSSNLKIPATLKDKIISIQKKEHFNKESFPKKNQVSDDLAYILHSSGSTGEPKGIMLSHRNARTFIDWMQDEFQITNKDIIASRAPFKFDLSVFDIFNSIKAGSTLICFDWYKERANQHEDYANFMAREKASILYTTPSTFIALMNRGKLDQHQLALRTVMYAGEPFPIPQLKKLKQILSRTKIANIYGPTETNIITYYWIDNLDDLVESVPLGKTVVDTEILVVTEDNKIALPEEVGELWCRGGTVTSGYLGREELNQKCLVKSPFHSYPAYFWRTGDYGYRDSEGTLYYRGRKDHMIKVKGFRIELGEIESALAKINLLDEFCVVAVKDEKYGNKLYCHYSTLNNLPISDDFFTQELKNQIPDYMVPYKFYHHQELPKTSSGKIDRILLIEKFKEHL